MNTLRNRSEDEACETRRGWDNATVVGIARVLDVQREEGGDVASLEATFALGALCARSNPEVAAHCLLGVAQSTDRPDLHDGACDLLFSVFAASSAEALPSSLIERVKEGAEDDAVIGIADYALALHLEGDDPERSIRLYEECIELSPENGRCRLSAMVWLAGLLRESDPERAIELCEKVVNLSGEDDLRSMAAALLVWTIGLGNPERALPFCRLAIELSGDELRSIMLEERALLWFAIDEFRPYALQIVAEVMEHAEGEARKAAVAMTRFFAKVLQEEVIMQTDVQDE